MERVNLFRSLCFLLVSSSLAQAFCKRYTADLPGAAPHDYNKGDRIPLLVNAISGHDQGGASETGSKGFLSYDYYNPGFGFCQPKEGPKAQSESLGSILFGDRLLTSPFEIFMLENVTCKHLCTTSFTETGSTFMKNRISEDLAYNFLIDGLPAGEMKQDDVTGEIFYSANFPLGETLEMREEPQESGQPRPMKYLLHNHFDIFIDWHSRDGIHQRVVGAAVWPSSKDSLSGAESPKCDVSEPYEVIPGESKRVAYTYSVYWRESKTAWATRWDVYLKIFDPQIHFLSLLNSSVIAIFLFGMVAMVLLRTLKNDITRYNSLDLDDDVQQEFGWKLVSGEVFRAPPRRQFFSVLIGSGAQLASMAAVTLIFALLGFLSPSNRGSLTTVLLISWIGFSFIAGFVAARVYCTLKGQDWRKTIFLTSILFPSFLFVFLHFLNFALLAAKSSGAIPFGTFFAIFGLWLIFSFPLTIFGGWLGIRKGAVDVNMRVNQIPRQIPALVWWLQPWPSAFLAGLLPFAAGFIEIYATFQALFGSKAVYYAFGYLTLTFIVVTLTTICSTVLIVYFALCAEDYRWHWRSFLAGGGSSFWLFLYGLWFWMTTLHLDTFTTKLLYLGYLSLLCVLLFMIQGTVGFLASFAFLRLIYSRIRVD